MPCYSLSQNARCCQAVCRANALQLQHRSRNGECLGVAIHTYSKITGNWTLRAGANLSTCLLPSTNSSTNSEPCLASTLQAAPVTSTPSTHPPIHPSTLATSHHASSMTKQHSQRGRPPPTNLTNRVYRPQSLRKLLYIWSLSPPPPIQCQIQ